MMRPGLISQTGTHGWLDNAAYKPGVEAAAGRHLLCAHGTFCQRTLGSKIFARLNQLGRKPHDIPREIPRSLSRIKNRPQVQLGACHLGLDLCAEHVGGDARVPALGFLVGGLADFRAFTGC